MEAFKKSMKNAFRDEMPTEEQLIDEDLTEEELMFLRRYEDVDRIVTDKVWPPPGLVLDPHPFAVSFSAALREVLTRLPTQTLFKIGLQVNFIISARGIITALNVPVINKILPVNTDCGNKENHLIRHTIVFFELADQMDPVSLIGLIAHEIAHSFVEKPDHTANEKAADELVRKWGFGTELDKLRACPELDVFLFGAGI